MRFWSIAELSGTMDKLQRNLPRKAMRLQTKSCGCEIQEGNKEHKPRSHLLNVVFRWGQRSCCKKSS